MRASIIFMGLYLLYSPEAHAAACSAKDKSYCAKVENVYQSVLGRKADSGGLKYWVSQLKKGTSVAALKTAFRNSAEYKNKIAKEKAAKEKARLAKITATVNAAYKEVLKRNADPSGRAYWVSQLKNGVSKSAMIAAFKASAEYKNKPPRVHPTPSPVLGQPRVCTAAQKDQLLAAGDPSQSVELTCNLTLNAGEVVTKKIKVKGAKGSNVTINCRGASLGAVGNNLRVLEISTRRYLNDNGDPAWEKISGVTVKNCTINGTVRLIGMATNGEGVYLGPSSRQAGHTARAQKNAPSGIVFESNRFVANDGAVTLYFAPGTNGSTVKNSHFVGRAKISIYLDAESANNQVVNNQFNAQSTARETLAVDGSANNVITGNRFHHPENGSIFLYRNCGEGGNIRHQSPQRNRIADNEFLYSYGGGSGPAIWLGSRDGNRGYCGLDRGYPFGSSANDGDFAYDNTVENNKFVNRSVAEAIRVRDPNRNTVRNNSASGSLGTGTGSSGR